MTARSAACGNFPAVNCRLFLLVVANFFIAFVTPAESNTVSFLLRPGAVFDGAQLHPGWAVLVTGNMIAAAGPAAEVTAPAEARTIDLPNDTLIPGMIEGHSHLFLHPYNETPWNDQVINESLAFRTARATAHAKQTLLAGFTTVRDLGTEGAGYGDVGLKKAIEQGIVPGPHMIVVTRAIVATGSYGPKLSTDLDLPQGAQEASGVDEIVRVAREQIGKGADWVKLYADYRWGPGEPSRPTFSEEEMAAAVRAAHDAGRPVSAHATTAEGMRRASSRGRRYDRARRRRNTGSFQTHEGTRRRFLPYGRSRRRGRTVSRLEKRNLSRARAHS